MAEVLPHGRACAGDLKRSSHGPARAAPAAARGHRASSDRGLDTCVSRPFLVLGPIFTRWRETSGRRAMANPEKVSAVAEITELFRESDAAVITEYRGLSVDELQQLRRALGSETTRSEEHTSNSSHV